MYTRHTCQVMLPKAEPKAENDIWSCAFTLKLSLSLSFSCTISLFLVYRHKTYIYIWVFIHILWVFSLTFFVGCNGLYPQRGGCTGLTVHCLNNARSEHFYVLGVSIQRLRCLLFCVYQETPPPTTTTTPLFSPRYKWKMYLFDDRTTRPTDSFVESSVSG